MTISLNFGNYYYELAFPAEECFFFIFLFLFVCFSLFLLESLIYGGLNAEWPTINVHAKGAMES
tara:strand:+ start:148 stop:339 length:192 start_codon:yes stop_codon:yes gene_type:complete